MGPSGLTGQATGPKGQQAWPLGWDGQPPPQPWLLPGRRPEECVCVCVGVCLAPQSSSWDRNPKYERVPHADPRPSPVHLAYIALHWLVGDRRTPSRGSIPGVPLPQCASLFCVPQGVPGDAPLNPLDSAFPEAGRTPKFPGGAEGLERSARGECGGGPRTAAVSLTWAAPPRTGRGGRSEPPRAAATAAAAASRSPPCASSPRIPVRMARARAGCKGRARHVLEQVGGRWGRSPPALRVPGTSRSSGPPQTVSSGKCLGAHQIWQVVPLEPSGNRQLLCCPLPPRPGLHHLHHTAHLPGLPNLISAWPCSSESSKAFHGSPLRPCLLSSICHPELWPPQCPLSPEPFLSPGTTACTSAHTAWCR